MVADEAECCDVVLDQEFALVSIGVEWVIRNEVFQRTIVFLEVIEVVLGGLLHDNIDSLLLSVMLDYYRCKVNSRFRI